MLASKPVPAITANRSPFRLTTSIWRGRPDRPFATAPSMVVGSPRLEASRFAVPAGMIATVAPLPHAVAAPHEEVLGALVEKPLHLLGCLAALWHLCPHRIFHPVLGEAAAKLRQATLERLASMGDDCDLLRHDERSPASSAAFAARAAASATTRVPMPTSMAAPTSVGWCMPR